MGICLWLEKVIFKKKKEENNTVSHGYKYYTIHVKYNKCILMYIKVWYNGNDKVGISYNIMYIIDTN